MKRVSMLADICRALGQLPEPRLRNVLILSVSAALMLLAGLWAAVFFILSPYLNPGTGLPWYLGGGYVTSVLEGLLLSVLAVGTLFLFPPLALAITGLFLEKVVRAVEDKHYPGLGAARRQTLSEAVWGSVKFALWALLLNLLILPFLFAGPAYLVVYYTLNGFLLGREYFDVVVLRRRDPTQTKRLRRKHRASLWLAGVGITALLNIPVLNLIIPVLAVAYMVHYVMRIGGVPPPASQM